MVIFTMWITGALTGNVHCKDPVFLFWEELKKCYVDNFSFIRDCSEHSFYYWGFERKKDFYFLRYAQI